MTQGKDDLPEKLNEWLRREGYPFEMRVAQSFRKAARVNDFETGAHEI